MTMTFRDLAREMRKAQKDYFALVTSKDAVFRRLEISRKLQDCKRLEASVDRWLEMDRQKMIQCSMFGVSMRTDETAGVYNVSHELQTEETKES